MLVLKQGEPILLSIVRCGQPGLFQLVELSSDFPDLFLSSRDEGYFFLGFSGSESLNCDAISSCLQQLKFLERLDPVFRKIV